MQIYHYVYITVTSTAKVKLTLSLTKVLGYDVDVVNSVQFSNHIGISCSRHAGLQCSLDSCSMDYRV